MKLSFRNRKRLTGLYFVGPWAVAALLFLVYPFIFSVILSFSRLENADFSTMGLIGFANYKKAFISDVKFLPAFYSVVSDTLVNTPMIVIFSLLIAMILNRNIAGRGVFRSLFFLPVLLGGGLVFEQIVSRNVDGQSMELAMSVLLPEKLQSYLGPEITGYINSFFGRITLILWKSGVQIVISLSGLQSISPALYEAARVDGATEWEMFWKITLMMMSPIILLNAVYTIVISLTENNSVVSYITEQAFGTSPVQFEFSAAMGCVYLLFTLLLVLLVFALLRPFIKRVQQV